MILFVFMYKTFKIGNLFLDKFNYRKHFLTVVITKGGEYLKTS